jgi:membrane fusion protein, multidrug efflux system
MGERRMRTSSPGALGAALVTLVLAACGGEASGSAPGDGSPAPGRTVSVQVEEAVLESFTDFLRVVGSTEAFRDVTVSAEEGGVVRQLFVERGSAVAAGQPLARIDERVHRAQYERLTAEASLATETYQRQRRLWEEEGIGSEMNYLRARYQAQAARAALEEVRIRLERTVVRAPIAGIVDARLVEVGSMVAPGTPVARVVESSRLRVTGGVPERFAAEVRAGSAIQVEFDGVAGSVDGVVQHVGATLNSASRTFPIEVAVANPQGRVRPGMVANLRIARSAERQAVRIPQEAVQRREQGHVVFVAVERDGELVAQRRDVVLGSSAGGRVVVDAGVEAGDLVIVVGQQQVAPGDRLQLVESGGGA